MPAKSSRLPKVSQVSADLRSPRGCLEISGRREFPVSDWRIGGRRHPVPPLTPLLLLKYHNSIADALDDLGKAEEIGRAFAGFQKYLYQEQAAA